MTRFIGNMKNEFGEQNLPQRLYNILFAYDFEIVTTIVINHTILITVAVTHFLIITTIAGATTSCVK